MQLAIFTSFTLDHPTRLQHILTDHREVLCTWRIWLSFCDQQTNQPMTTVTVNVTEALVLWNWSKCCNVAAELSSNGTYSSQMVKTCLCHPRNVRAHWQLSIEPHAQVSNNSYWLYDALVDIDAIVVRWQPTQLWRRTRQHFSDFIAANQTCLMLRDFLAWENFGIIHELLLSHDKMIQ